MGKQQVKEQKRIIWKRIVPVVFRDKDGLIKYEAGKVVDITESKNAEQKLIDSQKELKKTLKELSDRNFELDQIVHRISHDLRSPLTSILGLVNIIQIEEDPKQITHYVNLIESRIHKLDSFVKSMLSFGRSSRFQPTMTRIIFKSLINDCLKDLEYLPDFHKIQIHKSIDEDQNIFIGDPLIFQLIFGNIISNTFKYMDLNKRQSYLRIKVAVGKELTLIKVWDNGIGIEKQYLSKIYDMFFRGSHKSDGSGLGLYIVKQSVDKLNGKIKIKSEFGKFTEVELRLPTNYNSS